MITKSQDTRACQTSLLLFFLPRTMGTSVGPTGFWHCLASLGPIADLFPRRYKFDFAVLLAEIVRNKLPIAPFRRWFFVDTLIVVEAAKEEVGPCLKLQCLVRHYTDAKDLRAHRAASGTHTHTHMGPHEPFGSLGFHRIRFCFSLFIGPR